MNGAPEMWGCQRCGGGPVEMIASGRNKDWFHFECAECGNACPKSATEYGALINWNHQQGQLHADTQAFWDIVENDQEFWK